MDASGKIFDAALHLLDRQILDMNGRYSGNVDDLELTFPEDGSGPPIVTAILAGPGALAHRIGGRLGAWIESVHRRLHPEEIPGPARIGFGVVKKIDNHIEVSVEEKELAVDLFQRWTRDRIIGKIPGADRATG
jgi:sporulation protein YlmC with PRC-barrel domain